MYDEGVKNRIRHFTKGYHEERRAKEAALREREEALRIAQSIIEENKKLKGSLDQNQAVMIDGFKKMAATEMEKAKAKYKEAYESGDADAMAEAQANLTSATLKFERVQNLKPQALQSKRNDVKTDKTVEQPVVNPASTRTPGPLGVRHSVIVPGAGRKFRPGSSPLILNSMEWPRITGSVFEIFSPMAMRNCSRTKSTPATSSLTGCST